MSIKQFCKKNIPPFALVMIILALVSVLIKVAAVVSEPFADFFNRNISALFRAALAHLSSLIPFSIAETLIICAVPLAVLFIVYCIKVSAAKGTLLRQFFRVLALLCFIFVTFVWGYGTGYDAPTIEERLETEIPSPSADELYSAFAMAAVKTYEIESKIQSAKSGSTVMPYSFDEMVDKLNSAYDTLYEEYDFLTPLHTGVKQIALSRALTYTHMSGFYTFFTGEANVNTNYPDYVIVYTTAHEMAHQRGIAREDEANYIAFLACITSDDPYIRYCGYANIIEYIATALAKADPEKYENGVLKFMPTTVKNEYYAFNAFFERYRASTASKVSSAANDTYLKVQGVSEGEESYGLVVDLATVYLNSELDKAFGK